MNIEQARFNMIEQQIRPWEVLDPQVLDLLFVVKREDFVPAAYRNLAFADMEIPIGSGQVMLAPRVEARLLQELALHKHERVLEVGAGTGALLAGPFETLTLCNEEAEKQAAKVDAAKDSIATCRMAATSLIGGQSSGVASGLRYGRAASNDSEPR